MVIGGSLNSSQWLLPLWKSKKHINEHKMNGSWWYIEVLWSETTGLCKNLNIITCNAEPQTNSPEWCPLHERIIRLNRFFLVNYLIQFTNQHLKQFTARAAQSYSIKTVTPTQHEPRLSQTNFQGPYSWTILVLRVAPSNTILRNVGISS